ncbi:MAG: trimethylamine methyltransferase family protein, partial [Armatimonadetes bacterium]|nr:trimethylamine methyltransferase family protein [Armatimonadota bacterium]
MLRIRSFSDSEVEAIGEAVARILERVGILCQNQELLTALENAGAIVDREGERAYFPRSMVADYVERIRAKASQQRGEDIVEFSPPGLPGIGTQVAQLYYDYDSKQRRRGNKNDFITVIKLGDVLHGQGGVGHGLLLTDVPPMLEPLEAGMLLAEYAHNPGPPFAWNVRQVDYLVEMGQVLGLEQWFSWGAICFGHPLRFDRDVADRFVRRVREGHPTGLTAMPVAGVTAPVTAAGFVAMAAAEHLATWIAALALNPDVQLSGSMWAGSIDMRTGHVSYSAFDAMLYAFATVDFIERWCGIKIPVGGGEYCDAREPGMYAALEKAYKALLIAAFTGTHPGIGSGMLEEGKTLCPVQLLLERDLAGGLAHLGRPLIADEETLALELVEHIGLGFTENYLQADHTLAHFRDSCWLPQLIDRSGWAGAQTDEAVLASAQR